MSKLNFTICETAIGFVLIASSDKGICAVILGDGVELLETELQHRFEYAQLIREKLLPSDAAKVIDMIESPGIKHSLVFDIVGTPFQMQVWQALQDIPVGSTASYADIARKIGSPKAMRAVAQACAANPLAIVIPCHRVIRSDGSLSGYRWGIQRKRMLLDREAYVMQSRCL